jgi:hypothetical protein
MTISVTPAAVFRMLLEGPITLLFDEIDAVFNPKTGGNNEDLRTLLNAGYKRTATVARCVGDAKKHERHQVPRVRPGRSGRHRRRHAGHDHHPRRHDPHAQKAL